MPVMQNVIDRPQLMVREFSQEEAAPRAALAIVDALAEELAANAGLDRAALIAALRRRVRYEVADSLWPEEHQALQAALVGRLIGRLARA